MRRIKKRRNYKNLIIRIVILTFAVFSIFTVINKKAEAKIGQTRDDVNITNLAYYNLIVFNNYNMQDARIEGALAVGSNITINSGGNGNPEVCGFISKGANAGESLVMGKNKNLSPIEEPLDNDKVNPSLLLGGSLDISGSGRLLNAWSNHECPIIVDDGYYSNFIKSLNKNDIAREVSEMEVSKVKNSFKLFKEATNNYVNKVNSYKGRNLGDLLKLDRDGWKQGTSDVILVNNIKKDATNSQGNVETIMSRLDSKNGVLDINCIHVPDIIGSAKVGDSGENCLKNFVIISDAKEVKFNQTSWTYNKDYIVKPDDILNGMLQTKPGNKTAKRLAQHITWVFPNATKIDKNGGDIYGSVIAPNATMDIEGGNIIGQVILNNLNQTHGGEFCSLLDRESLKLNNKTVLYGDKVNLEKLLGNCILDENILDGYRYTWTKASNNEVVCKGKVIKKNNEIILEPDKGYSGNINPSNTDNYILNIKNTMDKDVSLKATSKVRVLKPIIEVNKNVNSKEIDEKQAFSIKVSEKYDGSVPVFINSQEWNVDVYVNKPLKIINLTRGKYTISERETGGYNLNEVTVNGVKINSKEGLFEISQNGNNVTLNGQVLEGDNPVIKIEVTNSRKNIDYYHSQTTIRNMF